MDGRALPGGEGGPAGHPAEVTPGRLAAVVLVAGGVSFGVRATTRPPT